MCPEFLAAADAVQRIPDGATIATDGFTMMGVAEELLSELEARYLASGSPRDLVVIHAAGQSDRVGGFEHFAVDGMVRRVVGSHWGLMPRMSSFLGASKAECVCLPQGQITATFRATAAGRPGHLSRIGLNTFVDPRLSGGKVNDAAGANSPDYVEAMTIDGATWLLYKSVPIDVAIIRATQVDENGNCSQDEEAVWLDTLAIVQAARASGGIVLCQAKKVVPAGSIPPRQVTIPGNLVDIVSVVSDASRSHRQTHGAEFDPIYLGRAGDAAAERRAARPPYSPRLAVARRVIRFLCRGDVVNLGTGIPGDTVGPALEEIGAQADVLLTLESGVYGGVPAGGVDFGIAKSPSAIIPQSAQFDFYNGGGLDAAIMGLGQVDAAGNVNVSALGGKRIGCGGFIDITQSARRVYFCFLFTGKHPKFVTEVNEISFSAEQAMMNGQEVKYVSDKALFSLTPNGLRLDEMSSKSSVAEIRASIPFEFEASDALSRMPDELFQPEAPQWTLRSKS
jgi:propionate CoA-transferase